MTGTHRNGVTGPGRGPWPRPGLRALDRIVRRAARTAIAGTVLLAGCGPLGTTAHTDSREVLVLEVAPHRVPCVGEMRGMCLQVRDRGETEWRKFYDRIEGFEHEAGVRYVLEVERQAIPNPLADGSAYAYRLLGILEEQVVEPPDPQGTPS